MIYKIDPKTISPYLKDASNYSGGSADKVIIPESIDELASFLKTNTQPITIAGAGTGMTASRIPESGCIISLERFDSIGNPENGIIDVGPAVSLANLYKNIFIHPILLKLLRLLGEHLQLTHLVQEVINLV